MTTRLLFILKRREDYNAEQHSSIGLSTGLYNSAKTIQEMVNENDIDARLEVVVDNNCIDRVVTKHEPTHVIIEALWCVPTKFVVLTQLHPNVKWIIRLHSETPFLANEGMAFDWIADYISHENVSISANSPKMFNDLLTFLKSVYPDKKDLENRILYLPNYYPQQYNKKTYNFKSKKCIDIACFGAVRPLKNHLIQAIAALKFANKINKKLRFHINSDRIEMKGDSIINNLKRVFENLVDSGHELIVHKWTPREEFLKLCATIDIGMQVSFNETFNIVCADMISRGVPFVSSPEVVWASKWYVASPTSTDDIVNKLLSSYKHPKINVFTNQRNLTKYTNNTKKIWTTEFK